MKQMKHVFEKLYADYETLEKLNHMVRVMNILLLDFARRFYEEKFTLLWDR